MAWNKQTRNNFNRESQEYTLCHKYATLFNLTVYYTRIIKNKCTIILKSDTDILKLNVPVHYAEIYTILTNALEEFINERNELEENRQRRIKAYENMQRRITPENSKRRDTSYYTATDLFGNNNIYYEYIN